MKKFLYNLLFPNPVRTRPEDIVAFLADTSSEFVVATRNPATGEVGRLIAINNKTIKESIQFNIRLQQIRTVKANDR